MLLPAKQVRQIGNWHAGGAGRLVGPMLQGNGRGATRWGRADRLGATGCSRESLGGGPSLSSADYSRDASSAGLGALQERDELFAELGGKGRLAETLRRVHGPLVRIDEGHAWRAALDVPFEQLSLLPRQCAVHIVREKIHALGTSDVLRR